MEKFKCTKCAAEKEAEQKPGGWKMAFDDRLVCDKCWNAAYMLRAVTIPIASPIEATWDEFGSEVRSALQASTQISNWTIREMAKHDVTRMPSHEKLPKIPTPLPYLYPNAVKIWPHVATTSVQSTIRAVERKYKAKRFDTVWRSAASLPNYRYPVPFPIHNQSWSVRRTDDGAYLASFRLLSTKAEESRRWTVRLRGGYQWKKHLRALDRLIAGEASKGEMAIILQKVQESAHRPGLTDREPGGGGKKKTRIMAKFVLWLPKRQTPQEKEGVMVLSTSSYCFWLGEIEDLAPWILNADHVRRWVRKHEWSLQRFSEDMKREKRWPKRVRMRMNESRETRCDKQHARISTFMKQAVSMAVKYAARRRVAEIEYNDLNRSYVSSFPWAQLSTLLAQKCDEYGIKFTRTSAEVIDESQESL